jgi:subtilisin-like proprotein convertase family protein
VLVSDFDANTLDICADATYDITITWNATDACGNAAVTQMTVITIVPDTEVPVITPPLGITLDCDDISGTTDPSIIIDSLLAEVIVTDNCNTDPVLVHDFDSNTLDICADAAYDITITWNATDACGNEAITQTTIITIEPDLDAPVINTTSAENFIAECNGASNSAEILAWLNNNGGLTATDNCSEFEWSNDYGTIVADCGTTGEVAVTFTATDNCGNASSETLTFTINDTTDPYWEIAPQDLTLECTELDDPYGAIEAWLNIAGGGEAEDSCSLVVYTNDFDGFVGSCGNTGSATVIFTATDACGNSTDTTAIVTLIDITPPSLAVPAQDTVVSCDGAGNMADLDSWLANYAGTIFEDACSEPLDYDSLLISMEEGCGSTATFTYAFFATDACDNVSAQSITTFTIIDNTPPSIDVEASNSIAECNGTGNIMDLNNWLNTNGGAMASDICGTVAWSYDLVQESDLCDLTGGGTYRFTATDECGNTATTEAIFEIQDNIAPIISADATNIDVVCDGNNNVTQLLNWLNNNGNAVATDNCNEVIWTNDYGQVAPGTCEGEGSITVTFTATDGCGNFDTTTGIITIVDTNDPVWTIDPTDLTLECTDDIDPMNSIMAWLDAAGNGDAFDSCSVIVYSNSFVALTGGCGGNSTTGIAEVIFTATDACGNIAERTATVLVEDTTPPVITSPAIDTLVQCDGACTEDFLAIWLANQGGATSEDLCGDFTWNEPELLQTIVGCGLSIEYVYSFRTTDLCGNVSPATIARFTLLDLTSIIVDVDALNVTVECDGMGNDVELDAWLNSVMIQDQILDFDLITDEDSCGISGIQVYQFTLNEDCGLSGSVEGTFTIEDTTAPVVTGGTDYSGECEQSGGNNDAALISWLNNNAGAEADDMCGTFVWTNNYDFNNFEDGCNDSQNIDVTFYATDQCGNVDSVTYNFSTGDSTPPTFTNCPRPAVIVNAPDGWCSAFVNFSFPVATDNCGTPYVVQTDDTGLSTGDLFPVGLTILEFTATDSCDNSTVCELKIVVNDFHTPPVIICPEDVLVVSELDVCGAIVRGIEPQVEDNCGDNVAVIFEVKDEFGVGYLEGIEDASGSYFDGGVSTVTYYAIDQPIVLITEIIQDETTSGMELSNLGPASMDLTCATLTRYSSVDTVEYIIPNGTILAVGDVFTYDFTSTIGVGVEANYEFSFLDRVIDSATINSGLLNGIGIIRIDPFDNDDATDWEVVSPCNLGSYGLYNPQLPVFIDNGASTGLQSEAPSVATCSFNVTVTDIQGPMCASQDTMSNTMVNLPIDGSGCTTSIINVGPGLVGEVEIVDLLATIADAGAFHATLTSPEGTEIILFGGLCDGFADIDISLDDHAVTSVLGVSCSPLGNGNSYRPIESFKTFFGESSSGDWTLSIYTDGTVTGTLDSWTLNVMINESYTQSDTTISNDPSVCEAEFTWIHPVFDDNCCEGEMTVTYDFSNAVTGETSTETENVLTLGGFVDLDGTIVTRKFEVGQTIVTYTLTDLADKEETCSFVVTVIDDEAAQFADGCQDVSIGLEAGECNGSLAANQIPALFDNCGDADIAFYIDGELIDINSIPIGMNIVTAIVTDAYGNMDSCMFNVDVIEFVPTFNGLVCNNNINLSLGVDCSAIVTADMILEGGPYRCYDNYCVTIQNAGGVTVDNLFDLSDVGQTFTVTITDCLGGGNSCWGYVNIEEKLLPEIECPEDIELTCNQDPEARYEEGHAFEGQLITGEAVLVTCEVFATITYQDNIIDNGTCADPRVHIIRRWKVTDNNGYTSTCDQTITMLAFNPDDVMFPSSINIENGISCADVLANPEITNPEYTGYPTLNNDPIFGSNYCDITMGYWDEILLDVNCPAGYDIIRHWNIGNDCLPVEEGVNPIKMIQRIRVVDDVAPVLYSLDDVTISVDPWSCRGTFVLPEVAHDDDCSEHSVKWNVSYGQVDDGMVYNLLIGVSTVTARVTDACGNFAYESFNITTVDATPPIAIALQNVVVSLTSSEGNGVAKVFAQSFDDGSYDGCSDVKIEIRREEQTCGVLGNLTYNADGHPEDGSLNPNSPSYDPDEGAFVKFCCDDIYAAVVDIDDDGELDAGYHKVWMRVWDDGDADGLFGTDGDNYNEAWAFVKVEDKLDPTINCPPDVTITCDVDYTDLNITGSAIGFGSCDDAQVEYNDIIINLNTCNEGFVRRRWNVVGRNDIFCDQTITINGIESIPVTVSFSQVGDFEAAGCPDEIAVGVPTWISGPCDIIGYTVKTDTFLFEDGACYKLINYWTVINWCTYEPNNPTSDGIWKHTQVIKVTDSTQPVIDGCAAQMYEVNDHADTDNDGIVCESKVVLTNSAFDEGSDNCPTGWLKWQVFVDLWGDGTDDLEFSSYLPPFDSQFNDTNNNGVPDRYVAPTSNGEEISIALPDIEGNMSNHKVRWIVSDGCQNVASCESEFMVVDKKAPTPYCLDISSAVMENDGTVELWAIDFNLGSYDNCTAGEDLRYTFTDVLPENDNLYDSDLRSSTMTFDCEDVANSPVEVNMYVWDEKGNVDYCLVNLTLVANSGVCGEGMLIAGNISTAIGVGMNEVGAILSAALPEYPRVSMTDNIGDYAFVSAPLNASYTITASKDIDYLNGVSTLDLVKIQRHILGLESLDSPYKLIAADINADNSIKASDLTQLRKLILGVITDLPTNESWRFVDSAQELDMEIDLQDVDYIIEIENLQGDMANNNMIAVKVGDVSDNATANVQESENIDVRSGKTLELMIDNKSVKEGDRVEVHFKSSEFKDVYGYQFTLELIGLEVVDVVSGAVEMVETNLGVLSDEIVTVSFNSGTANTVTETEAVFTMVFTATEDGQLSEMISITSKVTAAESYVTERLEIKEVVLNTRGDVTNVTRNELYQNEPNPFKDQTLIRFELAEAVSVSITVTDVAGKTLKVINTTGSKGMNMVLLDAADLGITGVMYYTVESDEFTSTKKMIVVR